MGKQVPNSLIKQIEEDKKNEIQEDSFNNLKNGSEPQQHKIQIPNKFSQQYATYIGVKPRAQASAKIRLGGVFR